MLHMPYILAGADAVVSVANGNAGERSDGKWGGTGAICAPGKHIVLQPDE